MLRRQGYTANDTTNNQSILAYSLGEILWKKPIKFKLFAI